MNAMEDVVQHDCWKLFFRSRSEEEEPLRADRWYYKGVDGERDKPEQSGL